MQKIPDDFQPIYVTVLNDTLLESNAHVSKQSQNLQTIPGIGKETAVAIIAESP